MRASSRSTLAQETFPQYPSIEAGTLYPTGFTDRQAQYVDSNDSLEGPELQRLLEHVDAGAKPRAPARTVEGRERVSFISVETGSDLVLAYAIATDIRGAVVSLILQRTPKFERMLPLEDRGVVISHEFEPEGNEEERDMVVSVVLDGPQVDIETRRRSYHLDVSEVELDELRQADRVLRRMHKFGRFKLAIKKGLA